VGPSSPSRRGALRAPLIVLALLLALLLSRCGEGGGGDGADRMPTLTARVVRVIDGDTIEVELPDGSDEDVRYIGIDTPETVKPDTPVQCGGPRAHEVNDQLVGGRSVTLRFDAERRDVYGRLLTYVYLPGAAGGHALFVNADLVRRGLARTLTIPPNDSFAPLFARLAGRAGARGRGLWGRCPL